MKAGDALFIALMIFLAFGYTKITDLQIAHLDKRITNLEFRVHIIEQKEKAK